MIKLVKRQKINYIILTSKLVYYAFIFIIIVDVNIKNSYFINVIKIFI